MAIAFFFHSVFTVRVYEAPEPHLRAGFSQEPTKTKTDEAQQPPNIKKKRKTTIHVVRVLVRLRFSVRVRFRNKVMVRLMLNRPTVGRLVGRLQ